MRSRICAALLALTLWPNVDAVQKPGPVNRRKAAKPLPALADQRSIADVDWSGKTLRASIADTQVESSINTCDAALDVPIMTVNQPDGDIADAGVPSYAQFVAASLLHPKIENKAEAPRPPLIMYSMYASLVAPKMDIHEQAMFFANVVWETMGFHHMEEIACKHGGCVYGKYYGRGMIQLTWEINYQQASWGIYGDDRLVRNPELAATPSGAWRTALFYWLHRVRPLLQRHNALARGAFGYSVYAINGDLECGHNIGNGAAYYRLQIYRRIMQLWGLASENEYGSLEGCGNAIPIPTQWHEAPPLAIHTSAGLQNAQPALKPRKQYGNKPASGISSRFSNLKNH